MGRRMQCRPTSGRPQRPGAGAEAEGAIVRLRSSNVFGPWRSALHDPSTAGATPPCFASRSRVDHLGPPAQRHEGPIDLRVAPCRPLLNRRAAASACHRAGPPALRNPPSLENRREPSLARAFAAPTQLTHPPGRMPSSRCRTRTASPSPSTTSSLTSASLGNRLLLRQKLQPPSRPACPLCRGFSPRRPGTRALEMLATVASRTAAR